LCYIPPVRAPLLVGVALFVSFASAQDVSRDGAVVRGQATAKTIALVFTGHEFAEGGEAILQALAARGAHASFFLTGDFLRRVEFAPLVRRIVGEGHYLGPHSDRHLLYCDWSERKKTLVSRDEFRADLNANLREIERFGVPHPAIRYFLPAYEWCNAEIVGWAREMGLVTVNFSPGTRSNADYMEDGDPKFVASADIVASILSAEASRQHGLNGFLLLLHVGAGPRRTDKMHARFAPLLDTLAGKGYRFVRVDELLGRNQAPR
jgi:peptidoglycan/xylan/chitin deacetylase (PgdA/CDA1 family)